MTGKRIMQLAIPSLLPLSFIACSVASQRVAKRSVESQASGENGPIQADQKPEVSADSIESKSPNAHDEGAILIPSPIWATPRQGNAQDDRTPSKGRGGLILMGGGTDVDSAFVWAHHMIAGDNASRQGDVLVLRASGADGYNRYIYELAPFNSVQTLVIPPASSKEHLDAVARLVNRSEFVFFAGGNQADYVSWRNSELMPAVQNVYSRGGVVGGTSAGLAILGQYVFDSVAAGPSNVTTTDALANPFSATISFTRNMLNFPPLKMVMTDTHFAQRDRFGRLASFLARQFADSVVPVTARVTGIGVDEATAALVDAEGRVVRAPGSVGSIFFVQSGPADRMVAGQTFLNDNLNVVRLDADKQYYDLVKNCGTGPSYITSVDGSAVNFYTPTNPYNVRAAAGTCALLSRE